MNALLVTQQDHIPHGVLGIRMAEPESRCHMCDRVGQAGRGLLLLVNGSSLTVFQNFWSDTCRKLSVTVKISNLSGQKQSREFHHFQPVWSETWVGGKQIFRPFPSDA